MTERDGTLLVHGSPRDPVWEYVLSNDVALASLEATEAPLVLVGHSHVALDLCLADGAAHGRARAGRHRRSISTRDAGCSIRARSASRATATLAPPGSCSISTRGSPRSSASSYDIAATQAEIREAGLPELLARGSRPGSSASTGWATVARRRRR